MNNLINTLKELKQNGCSGIKISFEDEGANYDEIVTMRYITALADVELSIKIGGCEAKSDINNCNVLNSDSIVAPMIESRFALDKFLKSIKEYNYNNKIGFNMETITAYNNTNEFLELFNSLNFVTFGRVDFVGSLNKDRSFVDTNEMYEYVSSFFKNVKDNSTALCYMGGAISINSKEFISKLFINNLIDKFETRYIIFDAHKIDFNNFEKLLYLANVFEVEWMRYIMTRYQDSANKDIKRIKMIEERININNLNI